MHVHPVTPTYLQNIYAYAKLRPLLKAYGNSIIFHDLHHWCDKAITLIKIMF